VRWREGGGKGSNKYTHNGQSWGEEDTTGASGFSCSAVGILAAYDIEGTFCLDKGGMDDDADRTPTQGKGLPLPSTFKEFMDHRRPVHRKVNAGTKVALKKGGGTCTTNLRQKKKEEGVRLELGSRGSDLCRPHEEGARPASGRSQALRKRGETLMKP